MQSPGPLGNYNCLQFLFFSLKNVQPAPWTTRQRWHCLRVEESPSSIFGSAWGACPGGLDKSPLACSWTSPLAHTPGSEGASAPKWGCLSESQCLACHGRVDWLGV